MKRAVYSQWVYVCGRERKENERRKEKERRGIGLNKAVGFAQSSRKTKWAQSKRPGARGLTGQILSQKCPTDCLCCCENMCRFLFCLCGFMWVYVCFHMRKSVFSIQCFTPELHILPSLVQKLKRDWFPDYLSGCFMVEVISWQYPYAGAGGLGFLSSWHSSNCTMWWPWKSNGHSHRAAKMKPNSRWLWECSHIPC